MAQLGGNRTKAARSSGHKSASDPTTHPEHAEHFIRGGQRARLRYILSPDKLGWTVVSSDGNPRRRENAPGPPLNSVHVEW